MARSDCNLFLDLMSVIPGITEENTNNIIQDSLFLAMILIWTSQIRNSITMYSIAIWGVRLFEKGTDSSVGITTVYELGRWS
jgi:hypothetical protein